MFFKCSLMFFPSPPPKAKNGVKLKYLVAKNQSTKALSFAEDKAKIWDPLPLGITGIRCLYKFKRG